MTASAEELLQAAADELGAGIADEWGQSTVRGRAGIGEALMEQLVAHPEISVTGYFGEARLALELDTGPPDARAAAEIATLAPNERVAAEVTAARRSVDVAAALAHELVDVDIVLRRQRWMRTGSAFLSKVQSNWLSVAERLLPGRVAVGGHTFTLEDVAPQEALARRSRDALRALAPTGTPADDEGVAVRDAFVEIADAAAWSTIAARVERVEASLFAALIDEEPARRPITLSDSRGAAELLRWATGTDDANRNEALRHVLTLAAATATATLPNAATVRKLAERQRIALTRDRAAEVQRAIADGQKDAADALHSASEELGGLVEETTKTANASIVGVIGLVVFIAGNANRLPNWLVGLATTAAVLGILAVVRSRRRRIADQEAAVLALSDRLRGDPLLPSEERDAVERTIDDFGVGRRARSARFVVAALGVVASAVAIVAAVWLMWFAPSPGNPGVGSPRPRAATTTTTPTAGTTRHGGP